jgi:hypothetical protein
LRIPVDAHRRYFVLITSEALMMAVVSSPAANPQIFASFIGD